MKEHRFGGDWTTQKLEKVRKYLAAYTKIFASNPRAQRLSTIYVDAFAGTGYRTKTPNLDDGQTPHFSELVEPEAEKFLKGSATIALEVDPPFKEYIFIERDPEHARELAILQHRFPKRVITIIPQEANAYLQKWCTETDWDVYRAVVFLDPYGMQVGWPLIEALARTKAVDLWILFPLGVAVNRLLTRKEPPLEAWAQSLTRIFGTRDWEEAFYPKRTERSLLGEEEVRTKQADFNTVGRFFVERLKTVFTAVAENPLPLRNSRDVPLYLLCFAAGNPKGAPTALRIAKHILSK